ncbi:MAG: phosphoribosylformylglycinamidine synthase subunit PurQ [Candidatus Bathyarchaeales archaeon]
MKKEEIRVCVLRVGGTNCDAETKRAFEDLGVKAEVVHVNEIIRRKNLLDFHVLVFPGGFSYGDYVRAGAIWAKWLIAKLDKELKTFVKENRPILGICNGFQVLVEAGLLPGFHGISQYPEASLATNFPPGYNCRWIYLKHENKGKCVFTEKIPHGKVLRMPVAHSEGRFLFPKEKEKLFLEWLYANDQLVFRYCDDEGKYADGHFPTNPNGSFHDIAGVCNPEGTIFGLMPHPERAFYWWQQPDWTKQTVMPQHGDGKLIFESLIEYLTKNF